MGVQPVMCIRWGWDLVLFTRRFSPFIFEILIKSQLEDLKMKAGVGGTLRGGLGFMKWLGHNITVAFFLIISDSAEN